MQEFQERVVRERDELDTKRKALTIFLGTAFYKSLPVAEQERLTRQLLLMSQYSSVLTERIEAFK